MGAAYHRVSFRYVTLRGWVAVSPSCCLRWMRTGHLLQAGRPCFPSDQVPIIHESDLLR